MLVNRQSSAVTAGMNLGLSDSPLVELIIVVALTVSILTARFC